MLSSNLPQLSVSTSTPPPPTTSPPVRIKAEPISPPRLDPHGPNHNSNNHNTSSNSSQQQQHHQQHLQRPTSADTGHLSPVPPHLTHLQQQHLHPQQLQTQQHQQHHQSHLHQSLFPHHDTGKQLVARWSYDTGKQLVARWSLPRHRSASSGKVILTTT